MARTTTTNTTYIPQSRLRIYIPDLVNVESHLDDPFPDCVGVRLRCSNTSVDLRRVFKLGWSWNNVECGTSRGWNNVERKRPRIRVLVQRNCIHVKGSPLSVVQGHNAFPFRSNYVLVCSFFRYVAQAITEHLRPGFTGIKLHEDGVFQVDLCAMHDLGSVLAREQIHRYFRSSLRLQQLESDLFRSRMIYDNSIEFASYADDWSVKAYIKALHPNYSKFQDRDRWIRYEVTTNATSAPKLAALGNPNLDRTKIKYTLADILNNARAIYDGGVSRLQLMSRQYQPERLTARPPVQEPKYWPAWHAWIRNAWSRDLYPAAKVTEVVRAYRDVGIDLDELPQSSHERDRVRDVLGCELADIFDPGRRTRYVAAAAREAGVERRLADAA
jgi:hypothetical protein